MLKKTWSIITAMLIACSIGASAQSAVGDWFVYPVFSNYVDKVIETSSKVYYLSDTSLFSFSTEDNETYCYTSNNKLNGNFVADIFYNFDKKYLIVTYTDGNMDAIYDDGTVYNLPEVKDAIITTTRNINDVAFGEDRMVLATDFGIVVYDDKKLEVIESGIYNEKINNVFINDGYLFITADKTKNFYASPLKSKHNTMEKFTKFASYGYESIAMLPDGWMLLMRNTNNTPGILALRFNKATGGSEVKDEYADTEIAEKKFYRSSTLPYVLANGKIKIFNTCEDIQSVEMPTELNKKPVYFYNNPKKVWHGSAKGIVCYDITDPAAPKTVYDYIRPTEMTCRSVAYLVPSKDKKRLYISNNGPTTIPTRSAGHDDGYWVLQTTNIMEDGEIIDVSATDVQHNAISGVNLRGYQLSLGYDGMYGGIAKVVENPFHPGRYFVANALDGVFQIEDGKVLGHYVGAPFFKFWGYRFFDVNIDPQGNLWAGHWVYNTNGAPPYFILPAAKVKGDPADVKPEDWIPVPQFLTTTWANKDMFSLFCTKSNMALFGNGGWEEEICFIDTKGTYDNPDDDTFTAHPTFTDQDGKTYRPYWYLCATEDLKGRVWIGSNEGVIEITDPTQFTSINATINRLKVPRNDGTPYADYLLASDQVNHIAVDASNRKWLCTEASGVYLVSENGDKILEHFTTENSKLPSNTVYSAYCDPNSNKVYFGTPVGLVCYNSTASPAKSDFNNVLAYPNPVRPDYTGWVSITGLMDNSVVKIADTSGSVVYQTRSEGGMAMWDACNADGTRVRSGVYYVIASENSNEGGQGSVVAKILVIR